METQYKNLTNFFNDTLSELNCNSDTRAYIVSIFSKYKFSDCDLSKDSLTLTFAQARDKQDFLTFQTLGDWIFFSKSFAPQHLHHASEEYYRNLGRMSYGSCYKLINRQWKLFEELSDNFIVLEEQTRALLIGKLK